MNQAVRILLVEENPGHACLVGERLAEAWGGPCYLEAVDRVAAAIERLGTGGIDLVLLDLGLPDSAGAATLTAVHGAARNIPVIVLTGLQDEPLDLRMVRQGAQDYLVKGQAETEGDLLSRAFRYALERNRAAQALQRSEARFRCLFDSDTIGLIVADTSGQILEVNDALLQMIGRSRDELAAGEVRWDTITPPEHTEHDREALETLARQGSAGPFEREYLHSNGTRVPVHMGVACLPETPNVCIYHVVDLTERDRATESIQWLTKAVQQSPAAILITDTQGRIEYVNQRFTQDTGYASGEVIGRTPAVLKSGETPAGVYRDLWKTITTGGEWRGELLNQKKTGERFWSQASISPLRNSKGTITNYLGVEQDVTLRKEAESQIRGLNESLERRVLERTSELAVANAELSRRERELQEAHQDLEAFTYSVSHDLRAPLRQIDGFGRILTEHAGAGLDAKSKHYLHRIHEGTQHMGRLVDDLLRLAQLGRQDLRTRTTSLGPLVRAAIAELRTEAGDRIIEWKLGSLPMVQCDPGLIQIVLTNLLSNALKYTRPRALATIEVTSATDDGRTVVSVRDNGVGFNMRYADKLFGVFQRLHRTDQFEGTGVGLATVKRIIHKHGGEIWAEAELDHGAVFHFTVGLAAGTTTARAS